MRTVFVVLCWLVVSGSAFADQEASVVYEQAAGEQMSAIRETLESSAVIDEVVTFLNEQFHLKQSLELSCILATLY